jgi:hypothetical protein
VQLSGATIIIMHNMSVATLAKQETNRDSITSQDAGGPYKRNSQDLPQVPSSTEKTQSPSTALGRTLASETRLTTTEKKKPIRKVALRKHPAKMRVRLPPIEAYERELEFP